ncbi:MAG: type II toxin-antitoxin system VapC family toxin [Atopobiaceae bacterium]
MTSAFGSVLLDTNVWLDMFLPHRHGHVEAEQLLDICSREGITVFFAVHSSTDVSYIVRASVKAQLKCLGYADSEAIAHVAVDYANDCVELMMQNGTAVGADGSDLWLARKYAVLHSDLEDDLVLAAVQRANAGCLVTNDQELIRHAPVPAMSVHDALALLRA